ncbi:ABC transporter substrate-binding protein [Gordonia sp. PDNC005]|uniref:ABC transporter substrate-binding protein n=1 Tax=unclassified Gordonia (in: high G+C Gram-positive bacteria) TaxID=2657482 RepID=UPI001962F190|nr:ABC transporter substrate-binding protein [Gordonia sp. PDNC005]QRY64309.1 ABC transporter substrate-binding protein [Gordonia sp. PDNC005]
MPRFRPAVAAAVAALIAASTAACSLSPEADGDSTVVVVGYQSKTINTVTAGTLLRSRGDFERRLDDVTKRTGTKYTVRWEDYDTGAPITTGMIAGKIDLGSMGDYPLLINGSRANGNPATATSILSVTGSSPKGSLNMVVTAPDSPISSIRDLGGKRVSASVGSAGHGTLLAGLSNAHIPVDDVEVSNQQPQVGASALESGKVDALAQFVAWPGLLVFQNKAKLIYDGAQSGRPTLHGTITRNAFAKDNPDVVEAFLQAQLDATKALVRDPLEAAREVAEASGLPAEVVYLYNGPGGTDFNPALKPNLVDALTADTPYLESIGKFPNPVDLGTFVDDKPLRAAAGATGTDYPALLARTGNDSTAVGEVWYSGSTTTKVDDATAVLRLVRAARVAKKTVTAAYITDALVGTRWFADHAVWLKDGGVFHAFTTADNAAAWRSTHPTATPVTYAEALAQVQS